VAAAVAWLAFQVWVLRNIESRYCVLQADPSGP
jgi:hypothetical protein